MKQEIPIITLLAASAAGHTAASTGTGLKEFGGAFLRILLGIALLIGASRLVCRFIPTSSAGGDPRRDD